MKLKLAYVAILVLILMVAAVKIPIYKASATTCETNAYYRKSLFKGDTKEDIVNEAHKLNARMALRFCAASGTIRYELFLF